MKDKNTLLGIGLLGIAIYIFVINNKKTAIPTPVSSSFDGEEYLGANGDERKVRKAKRRHHLLNIIPSKKSICHHREEFIYNSETSDYFWITKHCTKIKASDIEKDVSVYRGKNDNGFSTDEINKIKTIKFGTQSFNRALPYYARIKNNL